MNNKYTLNMTHNMNNEELVNTDSSPILDDRTTASAIELQKEIQGLLLGIFGNIEVDPGKFAIIPGRNYEVIEPLKQFILQRDQKILSLERKRLRAGLTDLEGKRASKTGASGVYLTYDQPYYDALRDVLQLLEGK